MKKKPRPEMPPRTVIGGHNYALTLLQIMERDKDGSPRTLRLHGDGELVELKAMEARGEKLEFLLGYITAHMLGSKAGIYRVPTMLTEEDAGPTTIGDSKPPMVVHWKVWARAMLGRAHASMLADCRREEPCWACVELASLREAGILEPPSQSMAAGRIEADADAAGDGKPWSAGDPGIEENS